MWVSIFVPGGQQLPYKYDSMRQCLHNYWLPLSTQSWRCTSESTMHRDTSCHWGWMNPCMMQWIVQSPELDVPSFPGHQQLSNVWRWHCWPACVYHLQREFEAAFYFSSASYTQVHVQRLCDWYSVMAFHHRAQDELKGNSSHFGMTGDVPTVQIYSPGYIFVLFRL